jgi:hypothetical protein
MDLYANKQLDLNVERVLAPARRFRVAVVFSEDNGWRLLRDHNGVIGEHVSKAQRPLFALRHTAVIEIANF